MIDYSRRFRLDGKRAVVVGGCGLLGSECASALGQAGAMVTIADIAEEKGRALLKDLEGHGIQAQFIRFDVADLENLKSNMERLHSETGGFDVWVNAAYPRTPDWGARVEDIDQGSWRKNVDMHLNAYALSSKIAAELMARKGGSIINLGSIYGLVGPDFGVYEGTSMTMPMAYSAIKGGIINVSRYLASYFGRYNVRVNVVCPGGIFDEQDPSFVANYAKRTPLGRMASKDEIAPAVVFLASDAASYVTGAVLMVDGGWTAI